MKKWDYIKLKSFYAAKKIFSKAKRQPTDWKNTLANDTSNKELISKTYKKIIQLNHIKINNSIENSQKAGKTFLQRRHIDGQQTYEKMLNLTNHQGNVNQNYN